ncbi:hypothetical protein SPD48_00140 [Pseudogracilibacillus sp. SE30717A]|uniref:hypothetical protein n=1 Tax=Pseudogracilibacillus sp. SE30717A TaxID=3098293 RepID=UPI00300E4C9E
MKLSRKDQLIIENYQNEEQMMVLIFAQWCVNNNLDAITLYKEAYPSQPENKALLEAIENTVPKEESEEISIEVVQQVLQLFGNDDLAFVIEEVAQKREN